MSHEIEGTDQAVYANEPAWHGLGTVVRGAMTSAQALGMSGDWEVVQEDLYLQDGSALSGHKANIRSDTREVLGVVSDRYRVLQNSESFKFTDALVEEGSMRYEAAFTMRRGKRMAILARMPQTDEVTPGDVQHRYILLLNSHDGTGAIQVLPTSVRVVCANTRRLALNQATEVLSITHVGDVTAKLTEARTVLGLVSSQFDADINQAKLLREYPLPQHEFARYVDRVISVDDASGPRALKRIGRLQTEMTSRYAMTAGTKHENAWMGFNAVTNVVNHKQGGQRESRFNSLMFGSDRKIQDDAWSEALELVSR